MPQSLDELIRENLDRLISAQNEDRLQDADRYTEQGESLIKRKKAASDLAEQVANFALAARPADLTEFCRCMYQQHRTCQQRVTILIREWLQFLADLAPNYYDLRNAASVEWAKVAIEATKSLGIPYV